MPRSAFPFLRFPCLALLLAAVSALLPLTAAAREKPARPPKGYSPVALAPKEPDLRVEFPGSARARVVPTGTASVAVYVGADGKLRDAFVTSYTDPAFGKALEEEVRTLRFQPARLRGVAVPGRMEFRYQFDIGDIAMTTLDAAQRRGITPKLVHAVTPEAELDSKLRLAAVSLPRLPAGYAVKAGEAPPRVAVTFFVDDQGQVHCPNADAAPTPELAALAMDAVLLWSFEPPTARGQPAVTLGAASVKFLPAIAE